MARPGHRGGRLQSGEMDPPVNPEGDGWEAPALPVYSLRGRAALSCVAFPPLSALAGARTRPRAGVRRSNILE